MHEKTVARVAAANLLALRVAYGAALLAVPAKVAGKRWLGPGAGAPAASVGLRGVGGREVALHGLALLNMLWGQPVRPLLLASAAGDLVDVAATAISRDGLPDNSAVATAAVAGGSAALSLAIALTLDE